MNPSEPFIQRPVLTVLLSLAAAVFGVIAYFQLPVNDLPDVEYPVMQVQASYPGANPTIMAQNVASPLEKQFLKLRGIESVTSTSRQGNTSITLQFKLGRSIDDVAPDVQAAINAAMGELPNDLPSPPTYSKNNPNDQPILYIGLISYSMTQSDLYDYAFNQVAKRLNVVEGVSSVDVYGSPRAVRVQINPQKLYQRGLTFADIDEAVRQETALVSAGELRGEALRLTVVPDTQLEHATEYGDIIIAYRDGAPIHLRDVAEVIDGIDNDEFVISYRSSELPPGGTGVVLAVQKAQGANAVAVAHRIDALLPQLEEIIPASIQMSVIYSRAKTIITSIDDVKMTLVLAFTLVVLVIFLFLGRFTDTLVPVVVMPMSLLMTFVAMKLMGFTIDNLSLMALTLSIGFLVDDAIVFLENCVRRMEDFHEPPREAATRGAKEISFTIIATSITLVAVFVPIVLMPGLLGRIFTQFGLVIIAVVVMSTILALTLTPMMCGRFLKPHEPNNRTLVERGAHAIEHGMLALYRPLLRVALKQWWLAFPAWLLIAGAGIFYLTNLNWNLLPTGDSSFISGIFLTRTGASTEKVQDLQAEIDEAIAANPNVEHFVTVSGIGQFLQSNFIISFISLKDPQERTPPLPIEAVNGELMGATAQIPGIIPGISPRPTLEISTGDASTQQGKYAYSISGLNADEVRQAGQMLSFAMMEQQDIFASVQSDLYMDNPELKVNVNREAAGTFGIGAVDIANMLKQAYSLNYSYLIKSDNLQYQVIIEAAPQWRAKPIDLTQLFFRSTVETEAGPLLQSRLVPFSAVASLQETTGPLAVNHINNFSAVTIYFNLHEGVPLSAATEFIQGAASQMVPPGLKKGFRGEAETAIETGIAGLLLVIVAGFVMYIVLGILYESYLHPLTVMAGLPVALAGGIATLFFFGQDLTLYSGIGLFMLLGIVQKNGIILIDFVLMRQEEGKTPFEAVYEASQERFRPIIMTTLSTLFGVLPIALGFGADGAARIPMGLAIVGGLTFAQVITLFITPMFFLAFNGLQTHVFDRIPLFQRGERMK